MRKLSAASVFVLVSCVGTAHSQSPNAQSPIRLPQTTPLKLENGKTLGKGPRKEHSGIVKSRQWPDVYWMHNDSGDEARVYAVRRDGSVYASDRYADTPGTLIGGAINVDWEDITVDNRGHLIVADTGNNENDRRDLVLYYLPEPAPSAGRSTWLCRVFFRYPDQRQFPARKDDRNFDCEAIFTIGDQVYILTKHRSDKATKLYRFDPSKWRDAEVHTLEFVDRFELHDQATAADTTPDGKRLVIATYSALWLFDIDDAAQPLRGNVSWLPFTGPEEIEAACFADPTTILVGDELTGQLFEVSTDRFVRVRPAQ